MNPVKLSENIKAISKHSKKYTGERFDYCLEVDFKFRCLDIYSIHIQTDTVSTITNLNYILSEHADLYSKNDEVEETTWIINSSIRLKRLWKIMDDNFADTEFIQALEKELDIDRTYSGWNSEYKF